MPEVTLAGDLRPGTYFYLKGLNHMPTNFVDARPTRHSSCRAIPICNRLGISTDRCTKGQFVSPTPDGCQSAVVMLLDAILQKEEARVRHTEPVVNSEATP